MGKKIEGVSRKGSGKPSGIEFCDTEAAERKMLLRLSLLAERHWRRVTAARVIWALRFAASRYGRVSPKAVECVVRARMARQMAATAFFAWDSVAIASRVLRRCGHVVAVRHSQCLGVQFLDAWKELRSRRSHSRNIEVGPFACESESGVDGLRGVQYPTAAAPRSHEGHDSRDARREALLDVFPTKPAVGRGPGGFGVVGASQRGNVAISKQGREPGTTKGWRDGAANELGSEGKLPRKDDTDYLGRDEYSRPSKSTSRLRHPLRSNSRSSEVLKARQIEKASVSGKRQAPALSDQPDRADFGRPALVRQSEGMATELAPKSDSEEGSDDGAACQSMLHRLNSGLIRRLGATAGRRPPGRRGPEGPSAGVHPSLGPPSESTSSDEAPAGRPAHARGSSDDDGDSDSDIVNATLDGLL